MLQRSEGSDAGVDCDDPVVALACSLDTDECPAACKGSDEKEDNTVVKSGDLAVKATAATNRKAIIGSTSDLDTITLKASEAITLNSVTLERFGYSSADGSISVWLEDENGTEITSHKTLTSKDEVTLSIKKDYKELDATDTFTIVASISDTAKAGTLGFKVTAVDSSAKNLDLSDYDPYTYDMVEYKGTNVNVEVKGKDTQYNYTEGEYYEVARLKVSANSSNILVNGFSFTNDPAGTKLDLSDFVDDVKVTVNGEKAGKVSYNAKKSDFDVNFDSVKIENKKNATFVVEVSFKGLDEFNSQVRLVLDDSSDIKAVEEKTDARVSIATVPGAANAKTYTMKGGKVTLSNTKLGNIKAAAGSSDVVFGEGEITLGGGSIELDPFEITVPRVTSTVEVAKGGNITSEAEAEAAAGDGYTCTDTDPYVCTKKYQAVDSMSIIIAGEEFEGNIKNIGANTDSFKFEDVVLSKSGKVQFVLDIENEDSIKNETINITETSFPVAGLKGEYEDGGDFTAAANLVGSISLNDVKIETAKGSLTNKVSKQVEFIKNKTTRAVVFDGTYTSKKQDVYLNEFTISNGNFAHDKNEVTYYLSIDGKAVASESVKNAETANAIFSDVLVKAGESVSVKVEAEVAAYGSDVAGTTPKLTLKGVDKDGTDAGDDEANLVKMSIKASGSITVTDKVAYAKNDVVLRANDIEFAKFVVKPNNNAEGVDLDNLTFTITTPTALDASMDTDAEFKANLQVEVDGDSIDSDNITVTVAGTKKLVTVTVNNISEELDSENGIDVVISYTAELPVNKYVTELTHVNLDPAEVSNVSRKFNKKVVDALVKIEAQEKDGDETVWRFSVDTYNGETVSNLLLSDTDVTSLADDDAYTAAAATARLAISSITDEQVERVANDPTSLVYIKGICYKVGATYTCIDKTTYGDYFKITSTDAVKIFKASN